MKTTLADSTEQVLGVPSTLADMPRRRRPVALVILSGGGFAFETKCLLKAIGNDFDYIYLTTQFGAAPGEAGIPEGESHFVPTFATITQRSVRSSVNASFKTFVQTFNLLRCKKIDLVIAVGCSHAIPMLLAGRLARRKTVFIESITRVDRLSNTGKLVYHLRLATIYLIQWPNLQKRYQSSRLGTVL